jgi:hypothetical protein
VMDDDHDAGKIIALLRRCEEHIRRPRHDLGKHRD